MAGQGSGGGARGNPGRACRDRDHAGDPAGMGGRAWTVEYVGGEDAVRRGFGSRVF
jgi:hypothetical protein